MTCEVCGAIQAAPVGEAWRFKLNAFVFEGLREHGLLAHIWCLRRLSEEAQESFLFLEPHEMFFSAQSANERSPDAEIDLLSVSDGVVRLCEIKSSNHGIELEKFANVALRLKPDVATLAVMQPPSRSLEKRLADLQNLLKDSDIGAELITLRDHDIEDSPHLPTNDR